MRIGVAQRLRIDPPGVVHPLLNIGRDSRHRWRTSLLGENPGRRKNDRDQQQQGTSHIQTPILQATRWVNSLIEDDGLGANVIKNAPSGAGRLWRPPAPASCSISECAWSRTLGRNAEQRDGPP